MIETLLENDKEWFNIPSIVRQALRLVVKENRVASAVIDELRLEVRDARCAILEWSAFSRLLESDVRDRVGKIECEITQLSSETTNSFSSLNRQLRSLQAQCESVQKDVTEAERRTLCLRGEVLDSVSTTQHQIQAEIDQRLRNVLQSSATDLDNVKTVFHDRIEATAAAFRDVVSQMRTDLSSQANDCHSHHHRSLHSIASVKESISAELVVVSNRVSLVEKSASEAVEASRGALQRLEPFESKSYVELPVLVSDIRDGLSRSKLRSEETKIDFDSQIHELSNTLNRLVDERTEFAMRRVAQCQQESQELVAELNRSLSRDSIARNSFEQRVSMDLEDVKLYLDRNPTHNTIRDSIVVLSHETASALFDAVAQRLTQFEEQTRDKFIQQQHESSRFVTENIENLKSSVFSSIEPVRKDFENIRVIQAEFSQFQRNCVEGLQSDVGLLRGLISTKSKTFDELRDQMSEISNSLQESSRVLGSACDVVQIRCDHLEVAMKEAKTLLSEELTKARSTLLDHDNKLAAVTSRIDVAEKDIKDVDLTIKCDTSKASIASLQHYVEDSLSQISRKVENFELNARTQASISQDYVIKNDDSQIQMTTMRQLNDFVEQALFEGRETKALLHELQQTVNSAEAIFLYKAVQRFEAMLAEKISVHWGADIDFLKQQVNELNSEVGVLLNKTTPSQSHAASYFSPIAARTRESDTQAPMESLLARLRSLEDSLQPRDGTYSRLEIDERFESHWSSVLVLLSRKEDHATVESKLVDLKQELLFDISSRIDAFSQQWRSLIDEKVNMKDLPQMFGSRNAA